MARTRLCIVTALALAACSVAVMVARRQVLGPEVELPHGPDTWKVTMLVQGKSAGDGHLFTAAPLDGPRQHVVSEQCAGEAFSSRPMDFGGDHRTIRWDQRAGKPAGPFRVRYDCYCTVFAPPAHPADANDIRPHLKPKPGEHLKNEPGIEADDPLIAGCARELTGGLDRPADLGAGAVPFRRARCRQRAKHCRRQLRSDRMPEARRRRFGRQKPIARRAVPQLRDTGPPGHRPNADQRR